jgi:hypothetical protein
MGASNYFSLGYGKTMKEAYNNCVAEANEYHGHQEGYSGEINCSNGFVDKTKDWKASKLSQQQYNEKYADGYGKGEAAFGLCIEEPVSNNNKIKSTVAHNVFKGTRKWELVYIPQTRSESWFGKTHNNKVDAVKEAREYTERTGNRTIVVIEKILSKASGNRIVADIEYKSNSKEKRGKYVFFGLANY